MFLGFSGRMAAEYSVCSACTLGLYAEGTMLRACLGERGIAASVCVHRSPRGQITAGSAGEAVRVMGYGAESACVFGGGEGVFLCPELLHRIMKHVGSTKCGAESTEDA